MKMPIRIILALLCAGVILCMPFFISSPLMLKEALLDLTEEEGEEDDGEVLDWGGWFSFSAKAAEADVEMKVEDVVVSTDLIIPAEWELPLDFSAGPKPNPDCYTEDGYEDSSIRVRIEMREYYGMVVHAAFVEVGSASQLRTVTAYGIDSKRTLPLTTIAQKYNPVIAMNGDLFAELSDKKRFEVRMTQMIPKRNKTSSKKDTLMIDRNGDFHLFVLSDGMAEYVKKHQDEIVNAFMFGPALVKDGEVLKMKSDYGYAADHKNPRSCIGQTGPLSYVMVIIEGRGETAGATHQEAAEIMKGLGCTQAYNLDGGNTAEMVMFEADGKTERFHFKGDQNASSRGQSDIIYFATAVPAENWQ